MTHPPDYDALLREAYRLGYEDRAREHDYDPGHALDLLTRGAGGFVDGTDLIDGLLDESDIPPAYSD